MSLARKIDGVWIELPAGPVTLYNPYLNDVVSYPPDWPETELEALGAFRVTEEPIPAGKTASGYTLADDNGRPQKVWQGLVDAPPPAPPAEVDRGAWWEALAIMGRFSEVQAAAEQARDSGTVEGLVVWARWSARRTVRRAELLEMAPAFNFTVEDADDSLVLAADVVAA